MSFMTQRNKSSHRQWLPKLLGNMVIPFYSARFSQQGKQDSFTAFNCKEMFTDELSNMLDSKILKSLAYIIIGYKTVIQLNSVAFSPSKIRAFPVPYTDEQTAVALVTCFVIDIIDIVMNDKLQNDVNLPIVPMSPVIQNPNSMRNAPLDPQHIWPMLLLEKT